MPDHNKLPQADAETRLNAHVDACFSSPAGIETLRWLRRVTIETVGGPEITNDQLRHIEGQRFIVGVIEQRRRLHAKHQKESLNVHPQPVVARNPRPQRRRTASGSDA